MNCTETQNKLFFYSLNELSGAELFGVEKHLRECTECRMLENRIKKELDTLNNNKTESVNLNFSDNVMNRIKREPIKISNFNFAEKLIPYAAAAILLIAVTFGAITQNMGVNKIKQENSYVTSEIYLYNDFEQETAEYFLLNE